MNKDYIVLSIQGQRLSTIPEEKLQEILARIGSIIVFNIGVEPEYKFIASLLKDASSKKDKALLNAVTIIANPSMEYSNIVDQCGVDTVKKYGFTAFVYQQVKMAYSLII